MESRIKLHATMKEMKRLFDDSGGDFLIKYYDRIEQGADYDTFDVLVRHGKRKSPSIDNVYDFESFLQTFDWSRDDKFQKNIRSEDFRQRCRHKVRYRGKCSNTWHIGEYLTSVDNVVIIKEQGSEYGYRVIPESVGKSTGMYDCNGTEIFEGDIIHDLSYGTKYVVIWRHGSWIASSGDICQDDCEPNLLYELLKNFTYEAIHNIFDSSKSNIEVDSKRKRIDLR